MVFVKVRETYDLHTVQNKMTVVSIHTPNPALIKKSYPGLLMQCRAYRPVSADVRVACASMLPLDPQGIGTEAGDVAPEDVFNPLLYKAISNKGMSQLEARINALNNYTLGSDIVGNSANVDVDSVTGQADEFTIYYGLLSETHAWKKAHPQSGLQMKGLKPYVYEVVHNIGDQREAVGAGNLAYDAPGTVGAGDKQGYGGTRVLGAAKPFPFINCTDYTYDNGNGIAHNGMSDTAPYNAELQVPWLNVVVGAIIVPPSRLHTLYYRMVCEWTIEFSSIRPIAEVTNWSGLQAIGNATHYMNYSYSSAKEAVTGDPESILTNEACMISANVEVNKVM